MIQGTPVFIWCRPEEALILLLGEGTYEGDNYFNGASYPIVKLTDGRELTVHYSGVWVGSRDSVQRTCEAHKGKIDVLAFDIDAYLRGARPSREQRTVAFATAAATTPGLLPTDPPKTATDQLLYKKREIDVELGKIELAKEMIAKSEALIATKRSEMATLKKSVLDELAALDGVEPIAAQPSPKPIPVAPPALNDGPMPTVEDFVKLASED